MNRIGRINQQLIVDSLTSTFLNAHSCGYHELHEQSHNINWPKGRSDYQLIYITKGHGYFIINDENIHVSAGDVIIHPPMTPQVYNFSGQELTCYYSLHFIGANIHLELAPLFENGPSILNIGDHEAVCNSFEAIISEFIARADHYLQVCNYYLYTVLLILLRYENNDTNPRFSFEPIIKETADYMRENYAKEYTVQDYATYANLSTSRFNHNFEVIFSTTPMKFITKIRLEHACWLLMNTQMPIAGIAHTVGYGDPLYFSRVFKKEHQVSPSHYRKNLHTLKKLEPYNE